MSDPASAAGPPTRRPRRPQRLRRKLAIGMTALALGVAALVALGGAALSSWLDDPPEPRTVTRVEQVGDQVAVVQIDSDAAGAEAAAEARRQALRWLGITLAASFLPAAGLAWLVAGRILRPVDQVAQVVDRVDAPEATDRVALGARDDELGELARSLDQMLDRLESHQQEQRQHLQEVLHELRTPLAVATTNLELAATAPGLDPDATAQVEAAQRALERMRRSVDDLGMHGRLVPGASDTVIDVATEARDLAVEHAGPAKVRGLRIAIVGPEGVRVSADRDATRTAVGNLLANAVRLAPAGSTITVGWGTYRRWAWLAVRDEGPGLPAAQHARVFERHWRGPGERAREPEAPDRGLGLTIARQMVEAQGGHVTIESREGAGSTFVVWLPLGPDAAANDVVAPDGTHATVDPFASVGPQPPAGMTAPA